MKCPKCKETSLQKKGYGASYSCPSCNGRWVQTEKMRKLSVDCLDEEACPPGNSSYDHKTGVCPAGHGIMLRGKVYGEEEFYLEKCVTCGGIWFDKGEWQQVAEANLFQDMQNFWSVSWQRKQQQIKNREAFLSLNKNLLGEELFLSVMELAGLLKNHPEKNRALALLQQEIQ